MLTEAYPLTMLEGEGPKSVWLGQSQGQQGTAPSRGARGESGPLVPLACGHIIPISTSVFTWVVLLISITCLAFGGHFCWWFLLLSEFKIVFFSTCQHSDSLFSPYSTPIPSPPLPFSFFLPLAPPPQLLIMVKSLSVLRKSNRLNHKSAGPTCIIEAQDMNIQKNPSTLTLRWHWEWRLVWLGPQAKGLEEVRIRFSPGASGGSITLLTLIVPKFKLTLDLLLP